MGNILFYEVETKGFLKIHEASVIDADYGYEAGTNQRRRITLKAGYSFLLKFICGSNSKGDGLLWN